MKNALLLAGIFLMIGSQIKAQFASQLNAAINDTSNGFRNFRGNKLEGEFSYSPKTNIDGTNKGKLFSIGTRSYYYMEIAGSESENSKHADSILTKWIRKIGDVLGKKFVLAKTSWPSGFKAYFEKGYQFTHGHLSLTIEHWKRFPDDKTVHFVRLTILFKPGI